MVQQKVDSKSSEHGSKVDSKSSEHGSCCNEAEVLAHEKHMPVAAKKTVLRDLQNVNRATGPSPTTDSLLSKNKGTPNDIIKLSGTKRPSPERPVSPPHSQSPANNAASGHLVYVRRKADAEMPNSTSPDAARIYAGSPNLNQAGQVEETNKSKYQLGPKVSYFPASTHFPMSPPLSSKPSVPSPLGKSSPRLASSEANKYPVSNDTSPWGDPKAFKNLPWEERFDHLQSLLKKLDESDQDDYLQMLRSLSSIELSRLAVELERRSIQLSLEEAKELQRVSALNVLGKSTRLPLESSNHPELSGK